MTRNDFPQCGDNQIEGGVALPASLSLSLSLSLSPSFITPRSLRCRQKGREGLGKKRAVKCATHSLAALPPSLHVGAAPCV